MTAPAEAWPSSAAVPRRRFADAAAFVLSVLMLLTYSEAWIAPLIGGSVDAESSSLVRGLYFPAYAAGLLLLASRPWDNLKGLALQPFLVLLLIIAGASTAWSVAPDQTLRREVALVATTLGGVALAARWRWPALVEVIAAAFAVLVVLSLIAGALFPTLGRMQDTFPGAWRGLWGEKNTFGGMMTFAFLAFTAAGLLRPRRAVLWWGLAGLAVLLLLLSTSKTSLVGLMLGLAALGFVLLVRRGGAIAVTATYVAVVGAVTLGAAVALAPDTLLSLLGKDVTLTGRTKIWAAVLRLIAQQPWLGYGYGAVWSDTSGRGPLAWIVKLAGYRPDHAHNSWLEQWLGMGLVGLGAWALCYLSALLRCLWAVFARRGALFAFPFLAVYSLMMLTESVAVAYNDLRWVLFVVVATRLALPERDPASHNIRIERGPIEPQGEVANAPLSPFGEAQRSRFH